MIKLYRLFLFLYFCLSETISFSQEFSGTFYTYFAKDGLSDNIINDLIADKDGVIWIATANGLTRFDNFNFINFSKKNCAQFFPNNAIDKLVKSDSGIFLVSEIYGIIHLNTKSFEWNNVVSKGVVSFFYQSDTSIFFYSDGNLELRIKNKTVSSRKFKSSTSGSVILYKNQILFIDELSEVLILSPENLKTIRSLKSVSLKSKSGGLQLSKKYGFVYHSGEDVYVPSENGNLVLHPEIEDKGKVSFYREDELGHPDYIEDFKVPNIKDGEFFYKMKFDLMLNAQIRCLYRFSNGCIFLGTNQGLFKDFRRINISNPIRDKIVFNGDLIRLRKGMVQDEDSSVYLMGYPGILKWKSGKLKSFVKDKISFSQAVILNSKLYSISDEKGLWVFSLKKDSVRNIKEGENYFPNEKLSCIYKLSETEILLAGKRLIYFNAESGASTSNSIEDLGEIFKIDYDKSKKIFLAMSSNAFFTFKINSEKKIEFFPVIQLKDIRINDFYYDQDKRSLWLASQRGILLGKLDGGDLTHAISFDTIATNSNFSSIVKDRTGLIWAVGTYGITFLNPNNFEVKYLNKDHGVLNNEFTERSILKLIDGRILIGGVNAYDLINPDFLKFINYTTQFSISCVENINADGLRKFLPVSSSSKYFEFKSGFENLILYLRNNDYINSSGYKFDYSYDGKEWQELPIHPKIYISNLSEGENKLFLIMRDPFGKIVSSETIIINSKFPFYRKRLFYYSLILLLVILFFVFIYLSRKLISLEYNTKSRIAMDLHDETGTILTRIAMLIQSRSDLNSEKEKINTDLKSALFSLRSFIDSMQKRSYPTEEFNDELGFLVRELIKSTSIKFNFHSSILKNIEISGELFRDIKLSLFELLSNMLKHSQAENCSLMIEERNGNLILTFYDDGVLVDLKNLEGKGNGIRNIKKRVKRNSGFFKSEIHENIKGLSIQISFKL